MDRILVVEDERAMREIIRDYLTAHGLECDLARDGQEALELLEEQDYDAVVLDVLMPRLDGFGVCRAVRRQSSVPICSSPPWAARRRRSGAMRWERMTM